jgi:hypothetical protein
MARLFWLVVMLAGAGAVAAGTSWAAAYVSVGRLLGAPPPEMGTQRTAFLWQGMPQEPGNPRAWRFAFAPTRIPGAPRVQIYVSPTGRVIRTDPPDLAARVKAFHNTGY